MPFIWKSSMPFRILCMDIQMDLVSIYSGMIVALIIIAGRSFLRFRLIWIKTAHVALIMRVIFLFRLFRPSNTISIYMNALSLSRIMSSLFVCAWVSMCKTVLRLPCPSTRWDDMHIKTTTTKNEDVNKANAMVKHVSVVIRLFPSHWINAYERWSDSMD